MQPHTAGMSNGNAGNAQTRNPVGVQVPIFWARPGCLALQFHFACDLVPVAFPPSWDLRSSSDEIASWICSHL